MSPLKVFAFALFLGLFVSVGNAEAQQQVDGPHIATGTGATEAIAKAAAEQWMDDFVDDFEANLDPGDFVRGVVDLPGNWDGTTYSIEFSIIWFDR